MVFKEVSLIAGERMHMRHTTFFTFLNFSFIEDKFLQLRTDGLLQFDVSWLTTVTEELACSAWNVEKLWTEWIQVLAAINAFQESFTYHKLTMPNSSYP